MKSVSQLLGLDIITNAFGDIKGMVDSLPFPIRILIWATIGIVAIAALFIGRLILKLAIHLIKSLAIGIFNGVKMFFVTFFNIQKPAISTVEITEAKTEEAEEEVELKEAA